MNKEIAEYIAGFPLTTQKQLKEIYKIIKEVIPKKTQEKLSWGMPTFVLKRNLVHFAAFKKHIGFYPGASGIENFTSEFTAYKFSKGAVQFPLEQKLPKELIQKIVRFRVLENSNEE